LEARLVSDTLPFPAIRPGVACAAIDEGAGVGSAIAMLPLRTGCGREVALPWVWFFFGSIQLYDELALVAPGVGAEGGAVRRALVMRCEG